MDRMKVRILTRQLNTLITFQETLNLQAFPRDATTYLIARLI
jgi:hypothetical protein